MNKVFPSETFESPLSHQFIDACKFNDNITVMSLLKKDKYLVYQFDHIKMTGLHWACKRGYYNLIKILCEAHSDLDAEDLVSSVTDR